MAFDLVIKDARVIDGSCEPAYMADVGQPQLSEEVTPTQAS